MADYDSWKVGDQLVHWHWSQPTVRVITRATPQSVDIGYGLQRRKSLAYREGWELVDAMHRARIAQSRATRAIINAEYRRSKLTSRETVTALRDACAAWLELHPEVDDVE
jgi:hypothetical protein